MAAEDRSLNSGISIPQWMKNKITENRFDLDQSTFSPPDNDDSFLFIRYPDLSKKLVSTDTKPTLSTCDGAYINHTAPCKQYIINPGYTPSAVLKKPKDIKIKSNGTDDGFKGEGAACGSSVVRVAHQMVSGKYPINNTQSVEEDPLRPKNFTPSRRRGSKSLPASPVSSPQTSPKSRRRAVNKYFTSPFADSDNPPSGWILQGLLSKREISQSIGQIAEESVKSDMEKSVSALNINESKPIKNITRDFKTKPSEYREMNFWSPTTM